MDYKIVYVVMLKNIVAMACFTMLAMSFGKRWIALFAAFFMSSYNHNTKDNSKTENETENKSE